MISYSVRKLAYAFVRLLDRYPRSQVVELIAHELVRQRRTRDLDILVVEIARQMHLHRNELIAEVRSAYALRAELVKELKRLLRSATGAQAVHLTATVDPGLVGGILVRTPELEFDFSVRHALRELG